jgi:hypothetical protein
MKAVIYYGRIVDEAGWLWRSRIRRAVFVPVYGHGERIIQDAAIVTTFSGSPTDITIVPVWRRSSC